jgi:acetolactate decarboxylase
MKKKNEKMKTVKLFFLGLLVLGLALGGCTSQPVSQKTSQPNTQVDSAAPQKDVLWQVSTINALMQGVYDGDVSVAQVKKEGTLGVGTFESLDGEMVVLDGQVYQVPVNGKAVVADDGIKVPFAAVTPFESDQQSRLHNIKNYAQLTAELDKMRPNKNMFYAFKITGTFKYIKTRSVPKQNEPYPPLAEVTKKQAVFEFRDIEGTLVGIWCPDFVQGVNVPGYHIHFLTGDKKAGGHVLDCAVKEAVVDMDITTGLDIVLPQNKHFAQTELNSIQEKDIKKVESNKQ